MSVFYCMGCNIQFDSDYHEMCKWDDLDVCEDCYNDAVINTYGDDVRAGGMEEIEEVPIK